MARSFAAPRHRRLLRVALAFALAVSLDTGARAQDAPSAEPPAAATLPAGQKPGEQKPPEKGGRADTPASAATAALHRLPPDSTTQQTLTLPGRTLAF